MTWQVDTDMVHHRLGLDPAVKAAANAVLDSLAPVAISSFTRVELKGNLIQDLILLRNKVKTSDTPEAAYARVMNTGGRRTSRMLGQLLQMMGEAYRTTAWATQQATLLTLIEGQIAAVVGELDSYEQRDDLNCTRASESPRARTDGSFEATIPKCTAKNTKCSVQAFFDARRSALEQLSSHLAGLESRSRELDAICAAIDAYLSTV